MKTFILTLIILVTPYLVNAQASKSDLKGKIGISLYGGSNIPTNGDYSPNVKTTDLLNVGSQFGVGVSYFITKGFGVEGTLYAGYNYYRDKYRPAGKNPVWINGSASINVIYNFGHMFKNPVVSPFARIGYGSYTWERLEDGIIGAVVTKNNKNHNTYIRGFSFGAGAEYFINKKFAVGLLLDYNVYFPKREDVSTDDRTRHGYFAPQLKLCYYIPTR